MNRDNYILTIISIPRFKSWFDNNKEIIQREYNLRADDMEHLYDYCVMQATEIVVNRAGSNLVGKYRHDVYDAVFEDKVRHFLVEYLLDKFDHYQVEFVYQLVKILVMGDKLILGEKK